MERPVPPKQGTRDVYEYIRSVLKWILVQSQSGKRFTACVRLASKTVKRYCEVSPAYEISPALLNFSLSWVCQLLDQVYPNSQVELMTMSIRKPIRLILLPVIRSIVINALNVRSTARSKQGRQ